MDGRILLSIESSGSNDVRDWAGQLAILPEASYKTLLSESVGTHPEPSHFVRAARAMTVARASRRRVTGTRNSNAAAVGFRSYAPDRQTACSADVSRPRAPRRCHAS